MNTHGPFQPSVYGRPAAFTLVELLVVVVVISILAGLLLPTLCRAKECALTVACRSNLRQVGFGLRVYVQENDVYPLATRGDSLGNCQRALGEFIPGKVFRCPKAGTPSPWLTRNFPSNSVIFPTYGYNMSGADMSNSNSRGLGGHYESDADGGRYVPVREGQVQTPSRMIALGDCPAVLPVPRDLTITITPADLLWVLSPHIFPVYSAPGVGNWHNGGANLVFCDAHVEYAKQSIWMATNAAIRKLWNTNYRP